MELESHPANTSHTQLSLVVPAYNEVARLPGYLASVRSYLDTSFPTGYDVIVVDDGSEDGLAEVIENMARAWPQLTLCQHARNEGKGAALRTGVRAARGDLVLFTDADGATPISEERKLRHAVAQGADLAVGSRLVAEPSVVRRRLWHRQLGGRSFAWLVRRLFRLEVRDPQCGFKMFRRPAALRLTELGREPGYLFDLELLLWARHLGYRVTEVPVSWTDRPGSKVSFFRDGGRMLYGVWKLGHQRLPTGVSGTQWPEIAADPRAGTGLVVQK